MAELINDPLQGARLILMLRRMGITDSGVLGAIERVPRSGFVGPALSDLSFEDCVLPIDCGQTIGRPSEIAPILQALKLGDLTDARVLVIGAGSGYMMAMIHALGAEVFGVERFHGLVELAQENVRNHEISAQNIKHADGLEGWPEVGPFDRIVLMGGVAEMPAALLEQLKPDGFCLGPVSADDVWTLVSVGLDGEVLTLRPAGMQIALSPGVSKAL